MRCVVVSTMWSTFTWVLMASLAVPAIAVTEKPNGGRVTPQGVSSNTTEIEKSPPTSNVWIYVLVAVGALVAGTIMGAVVITVYKHDGDEKRGRHDKDNTDTMSCTSSVRSILKTPRQSTSSAWSDSDAASVGTTRSKKRKKKKNKKSGTSIDVVSEKQQKANKNRKSDSKKSDGENRDSGIDAKMEKKQTAKKNRNSGTDIDFVSGKKDNVKNNKQPPPEMTKSRNYEDASSDDMSDSTTTDQSMSLENKRRLGFYPGRRF